MNWKSEILNKGGMLEETVEAVTSSFHSWKQELSENEADRFGVEEEGLTDIS